MPINKKLVGKLKISADDIDLLQNHSWCLDISNGYTRGKINLKLVYLHIIIAERIYDEIPKLMEVDHKDNNRLNCCRSNLRLVTSQQNTYNQSIRSNNTSGYKGVYLRKDTKKWQAQIVINRCKLGLGCYDNIEDAAEAYNKKALELFGEFANLNVILR